MGIFVVLCIAGMAAAAAAGPLGQSDPFEGPFIQKGDSPELFKPKNFDMTGATSFLRVVLNEGQAMWNPCNLVDRVQEGVKKVPQKSKFKNLTPTDSAASDTTVSRQKVLEIALPALRDGISLYRTQFVLQETSNLTVFLDQNRDDIYANTSLRSYSHYYVRAGNEEITQILFIGLIKTDDLLTTGTEAPAMQFLSLNGLIKHPRQYVDFATIPAQEAELILAKRQQMADLLSTQGVYWEDDVEYLTNIMTVAFNGPEQEKEFAGVMPKALKNYIHKLQENSASKLGDKYENVCLQQKLQKAADDAAMEAVALFAL